MPSTIQGGSYMSFIQGVQRYFQGFQWSDKHKYFGFPADSYPDFCWISSLEKRFDWLRGNYIIEKTSSIYLFREMIQWGGSQNGVLQKFDDRLGETDLYDLMSATIKNLPVPADAISSALDIPGMGLTYASKLLRFLDPDNYGALDSRVRDALNKRANVLPKIYDGNANSMIKGYVAFQSLLNSHKTNLETGNVIRPQCLLAVGSGRTAWRTADIEMALFQWAGTNDPY